ncbi:hypothetical protein QQ045_007580 [Rhodiola kirilowii]
MLASGFQQQEASLLGKGVAVMLAVASGPTAEQPSAPAPSKKEEIKESKSLSPAKVPAHIMVPLTGDRIFTSSLARKLAEENNLPERRKLLPRHQRPKMHIQVQFPD